MFRSFLCTQLHELLMFPGLIDELKQVIRGDGLYQFYHKDHRIFVIQTPEQFKFVDLIIPVRRFLDFCSYLAYKHDRKQSEKRFSILSALHLKETSSAPRESTMEEISSLLDKLALSESLLTGQLEIHTEPLPVDQADPNKTMLFVGLVLPGEEKKNGLTGVAPICPSKSSTESPRIYPLLVVCCVSDISILSFHLTSLMRAIFRLRVNSSTNTSLRRRARTIAQLKQTQFKRREISQMRPTKWLKKP